MLDPDNTLWDANAIFAKAQIMAHSALCMFSFHSSRKQERCERTTLVRRQSTRCVFSTWLTVQPYLEIATRMSFADTCLVEVPSSEPICLVRHLLSPHVSLPNKPWTDTFHALRRWSREEAPVSSCSLNPNHVWTCQFWIWWLETCVCC
jgi:hypothetical protein